MSRWLKEDNKGVEIQGIRWLLKEVALGKTASSLVIYMKSAEVTGKLRMGRKLFRTKTYHGKRPQARKVAINNSWSQAYKISQAQGKV